MPQHHIFVMPFAKVYPLSVQKAERTGRSQAKEDKIICQLTQHAPID